MKQVLGHDGPFTTRCPTEKSHWHGKKVFTVYDSKGKKVCCVPRFPYRTREGALALAEGIAKLLNKEAECLTE